MFRLRMAGVLVAALALVAGACRGDDVVAGDPSPAVEAPATTQPEAEAASPTTEPAEADVSESAGSGDASGVGSGDADGVTPTEAGEAAEPVDAASLLASAGTQLGGRSVRGEASVALAPGFELSTSFESDAEGDLAATVELPPGMGSEFPAGADAEMRYVGGVVYVRPLVPAEDLAELGVEEAWYVAEPAAADDPMTQAGLAGVMCIFPQMLDEPVADCDPVGETGALLEAASEAEIVGRENLRGVETTRARLLLSLLDLVGEGLGIDPGAGETAEGGAFDDTASDPFAEGVEQIFGFLDAEFEVEVWIDDEGLIRRLSFDLASLFAGIAGAEAAAEMPSSLIVMEFYDYDADISVDAPPPDAIVDEDLLIGGDGYSASGGYQPPADESG